MDDFNNKTSIDPFDRRKGFKRLSFKASDYLGHHELNHIQSIQKDAHARLGAALLSQGFIATGGKAIKGETVDGFVSFRMEASEIWLAGSMQDVEEAVLSLPSTGTHSIGIRLVRFTVDSSTDPVLKGMAPGTRAEGETMAKAQGELCSWGWDGDGQDGEFYPIYQVKDGDLVQEPASQQNDVWTNLIRRYDDDAHSNYIVNGCGVTALGLIEGKQVYSIAEGTVNVRGHKLIRPTSTRLSVVEEPDIETVQNEPYTLTGDAPYKIPLRFAPLFEDGKKSPATVMVVRQKSVSMVHGAYAGVADGLPDDTVFKIISIKQNATTYKEGSDYLLKGASVDWSPSGAEPAPGSTYQVVYHYNATVVPDAYDETTLTINEGVSGTVANISYKYKLPRWDAITIDRDGVIEYVKGVSSRLSPQKAYVGSTRMRLADAWNVWGYTPTVQKTGTIRITVEQERDMETRLANAEVMIAEVLLKNDISSREPVTKRGLFADPLVDDTYRDQGVAQTAAVFNGGMVLPISAIAEFLTVAERTLPYEDEVLYEQSYITGSRKINPYQAFPVPVPAVTLSPSVDIWSETETVWTSETTRRFHELKSFYWDPLPGNGPAGHGYSQTTSTSWSTEIKSSNTTAVEFMRQREVGFTLTNFGPGETLTEIVFDGVSIKP